MQSPDGLVNFNGFSWQTANSNNAKFLDVHFQRERFQKLNELRFIRGIRYCSQFRVRRSQTIYKYEFRASIVVFPTFSLIEWNK